MTLPFWKPWFVTRVSSRSCTGVSERRYWGTAVGWMPSVAAKAAFLAGSAASTLICFSTSQLTTSWVPPYTPGAEPLTLRVPVVVPWVVGAAPVPLGDGAGLCGGGLSGGGASSFTTVDSVKGSGPAAAAGCRNTSPPALGAPLGRVSTTARATTATTATSAVASRGTDRHQGALSGPGPPGPAGPAGPPGGPVGGGGGGTCRPPDSGPDGGPVGRSDGPVGRSDDGCQPEECVLTGSSSQEEGVPIGPLCAPSGWCPQAGSATVAW
ncbi:hypothetical protein ADK91_11045 [Streptomyces sp. XY511]|nr:hypothetical protein ADK91_11045 [Streptomyces sp. XY511]